jgi:hypothetical protein
MFVISIKTRIFTGQRDAGKNAGLVEKVMAHELMALDRC